MTVSAGLATHSDSSDAKAFKVSGFVALALLLIGYSPTLIAFPAAWLNYQAHGFVIAAFSVWLLWQQRSHLSLVSEPAEFAYFAAAACSMVWLAATIAGVQVVHMAMLPLVALAWTGAVAGTASARRMIPIALTFSVAVPLWGIFLGVLQSMTVAVSGTITSLMKLEAEISDNQIIFPFGVVEVAQSCAGMNYLMSGLTISVLYAQLFLTSRKAKIATIAVGVAISILSNWVRVSGLVIIGYYTRMKSPLMAEHGTYGWVIFAVFYILFFLIAERIDRWDQLHSEARPLTREITAPAVSAESVQRNLVLASLAALVGPFLFFGLTFRPGAQAPPTALQGVRISASWSSVPVGSQILTASTGTDSAITGPWRPEFQGASTEQQLAWTNGSTVVQVNRLIFASHRQDAELIGYGNRISDPKQLLSDRTVGPLDDELRTVREAVIRTPVGPRLVWYWYRVANVETSLEAKAKLLELVTFVTRGAPSELVTVSAACAQNGCQEASKAVFSFVTGREMPVQATQ